MDMLRKRTTIPLVHSDSDGQEKIILLKEEAEAGGSNSHGRPVGPFVVLFLLSSVKWELGD
jgi:hypothetical protein